MISAMSTAQRLEPFEPPEADPLAADRALSMLDKLADDVATLCHPLSSRIREETSILRIELDLLNRNPVTTLIGPRRFQAEVEQQLLLLRRNKTKLFAVFALVDVVGMCEFTNRSRSTSDLVLAEVGSALRASVRADMDVIGHTSCAEFGLFLVGSDVETLFRIPEDTRRRASACCAEWLPKPIKLTIGIATVGVHGWTFQSLSAAASEPLVRARAAGGDMVLRAR